MRCPRTSSTLTTLIEYRLKHAEAGGCRGDHALEEIVGHASTYAWPGDEPRALQLGNARILCKIGWRDRFNPSDWLVAVSYQNSLTGSHLLNERAEAILGVGD